jgi:hypothetical protein
VGAGRELAPFRNYTHLLPAHFLPVKTASILSGREAGMEKERQGVDEPGAVHSVFGCPFQALGSDMVASSLTTSIGWPI